MITRLILVGGLLAASFGLALIVPALVPYLDRGVFSQLAGIVVSLGIVFVVGGGAAIMFARRRPSGIAMPAPVRAAVMAAILFLAFCVLELSDGLLRRNGRIFYWTAVLFLPALAMLYGLLAAQRWAWWISRGTAFLAALWFVAFIFLIPFAELRTDGVPVPLWGRLYMVGVSLVFASISAYTFRSLGHAEAKRYFANDIQINVA